MQLKNSILMILFMASCTTAKHKTINTKEIKKVKILEIKVQNVLISPGKIIFISIPKALYERPTFMCDGKIYPYQNHDEDIKVYLAESYFSSSKKHQCHLSEGKRKDLVLNIQVVPFDYKKEKLSVDKKRVFLNKKDLARVIAEKKMLNKLYAKPENYYLFDKPFKVPLNSFITSHYGNKRIFNNKKQSQHLGNDFRAAVGVQIPAANKGKVIFAGNLFYSGNVVILSHGNRLYTNYAHLSKILVKKGTIVDQDDIVGLAGKTGRVSGPHLHWGVKLYGHNVDGFSLAEESEKHFK